MIFTFSSCPLPALSRSSKKLPETSQKHSDTIPSASGAPKSLSEMLWKHPRASLRRPQSTQRRLQRPQELPKASQDPPEAPTSLPKTSPKHSFAPFGAPGILKTNEFLKENNDFHFCVLSAPNALSEPQKAFPRRPDTIPRPSRELPRASLSHSRSSAGSVAPPFHSFRSPMRAKREEKRASGSNV